MMALFLEKKSNQVKIIRDVVKAAARNWCSSKDVIALLFKKKGN